MQYEDERRRRYLKERIASGGSGGGGTMPGTTSRSTKSGHDNNISNSFNVITDSQNEGNVQAAVLWWSALRPLTLGGRARREFMWKVVPEYILPSVAPTSSSSVSTTSNNNNNVIPKRAFLLQWFDPQQQQTPLGTIVLHELRDISIVGDALSSLSLVIGESAKAIRGTGGRTTVIIECASQSEAAKYLGTLQTLRMASEA